MVLDVPELLLVHCTLTFQGLTAHIINRDNTSRYGALGWRIIGMSTTGVSHERCDACRINSTHLQHTCCKFNVPHSSLQIQTTIQLQHPLQEPTTINTCIPLAKDLDNSTNASLPDSSGGGGGCTILVAESTGGQLSHQSSTQTPSSQYHHCQSNFFTPDLHHTST